MNVRLAIVLTMASLLLSACGGTPPVKTYTIGVVNYNLTLVPVLDGFKARMAALGYVEGRNVIYIYHDVLDPDPQVIEHEVKRLMEQKVDLFLTLGTQPTLAAKKATTGTATPVVFAPALKPVEKGIVESMARPGGNVTGVYNGDAITIPKSLEWLHKIVPHATKIYTLYHPQDTAAQTAIQSLPTFAASLGVEQVLAEVRSPEEAIVAIETMPTDAAIFFVPTPSLEPLGLLVEIASRRGIAVGANIHRSLETGVIVAYAGDWFAMGQQAARLVDQIFKGAKPSDLPVETAEHFLHINLKTATALGLDIPDAILRQADKVIR
jgi:putative tryptophan/tyrosine transport system substrate-binding protein